MNMRYGSSLNPKCMLEAFWRKKKVIFLVISAVSLTGNAVVLAESLGIHKTLTSLLSRLLPQLRDTGELLVQRPVLYMLLNLIMIRMVLKSGMLRGHTSSTTKPIHEVEIERRRWRRAADECEELDDHPEQREQHRNTSLSMKTRSTAGGGLPSYTEPAVDSNSSFEKGVASNLPINQPRAPRQASLFTIEPLHSTTIEPPFDTTLSPSQIVVVGAAQLDNPISIDTTPPNILASSTSGHSAKEPQIGLPLTSLKNPLNEVSSVSHQNYALRHHPVFADSGRSDDYDLNGQEFNERVETFITKFKRNLTMQRQDSFNRLLGLVGVGVKR